MERALHPDLAKRFVYADPQAGHSRLDQQSAMTLIQGTPAGYSPAAPEAERMTDVRILKFFENAASVKIVASGWIDYLRLAWWIGEWRIVIVLLELTSESP